MQMGDVIDFASYLRFVAALVFVLGLILVAAHLAKKFMTGKAFIGPRNQGRRLGVVEVLALDARHRAFLIRRDDKEHLIMTGPSGDLVIESGIEEDQRASHQTDATVTPLHGNADAPASSAAETIPHSAQRMPFDTPLRKIAGMFGDRRP